MDSLGGKGFLGPDTIVVWVRWVVCFFVFGPAKTIRLCSHFVDLMVVYCIHFVVV